MLLVLSKCAIVKRERRVNQRQRPANNQSRGQTTTTIWSLLYCWNYWFSCHVGWAVATTHSFIRARGRLLLIFSHSLSNWTIIYDVSGSDCPRRVRLCTNRHIHMNERDTTVTATAATTTTAVATKAPPFASFAANGQNTNIRPPIKILNSPNLFNFSPPLISFVFGSVFCSIKIVISFPQTFWFR